eukprot:982924-Rhodomonas_salina.2
MSAHRRASELLGFGWWSREQQDVGLVARVCVNKLQRRAQCKIAPRCDDALIAQRKHGSCVWAGLAGRRQQRHA